MFEFAYGLTVHNEITGDFRNPWNAECIPGGSSSGPTAAIASFLSYASLGFDTGDSIHFPATCCGLVEMEPTYGRVSHFGAMPFSFSIDHIDPLTRSQIDCALVTQIISGSDPNDSTFVSRPKAYYLIELESGIQGLKIGILTTYASEVSGFLSPIHPEVMRKME